MCQHNREALQAVTSGYTWLTSCSSCSTLISRLLLLMDFRELVLYVIARITFMLLIATFSTSKVILY